MSTPRPPSRLDDLRSLARALVKDRGPARPIASDETGKRARGWLGPIMWGVAIGTLAVVLTRLGSPPPHRAADPSVHDDTRLRSPAPVASVDQRAPTEIGILLALERPRATPAPPTIPELEPHLALPVPQATVEVLATRRAPTHPRSATPRPLRSPAARVDVPDLSGRWLLTNAVDGTTHRPFAGLRIRFRIRLEQHGDKIVGSGEKFTVNDRPIPPSQRSPIVLDGTVRGRDVIVRFVERGSQRASSGTFRWRLSPDGRIMHGTFSSTVAGARGRSHASRDG